MELCYQFLQEYQHKDELDTVWVGMFLSLRTLIYMHFFAQHLFWLLWLIDIYVKKIQQKSLGLIVLSFKTSTQFLMRA